MYTAVQAIVAGPDGKKSLSVSKLSIAAQSRKVMFNADLWATVPGGWNECSNCARVSLDKLPTGTERLVVNVRAVGTEAGIYLAEIPGW